MTVQQSPNFQLWWLVEAMKYVDALAQNLELLGYPLLINREAYSSWPWSSAKLADAELKEENKHGIV